MKMNLPITQTERFLEPGKPIVTKTDLTGRITYANDSFVQISGFDRDELIGSSHNIVRHPDMPPQAFKDLWRCLKAGLPWRGLVKNRTKEGDLYWVDAYVTPMTKESEPVGYISVRSAPSPNQVRSAESLYREIREKRADFPATQLPSSRNWFALFVALPCVLAAALAIGGALAGGASGVVVAGLAVVAMLVLPLWLHHKIMAPLARAVRAVQAIDEGRLNDGVATSDGPLADLQIQVETLRIHLKAMFCDVMVNADQVEQRAGELSKDMGAIVSATSTQADEVASSAAAIEQMSVSINEISNSTNMSLDAVRKTEALALNGKQVVDREIESSSALVAMVKESQQRVLKVNDSMNEVSNIASLINEIADQTNLLALNAAIEAARAGEHGRGFAVVADEVRKLAERTSQSTKSIAGTIDGIRADVETAVHSMERVVSGVELSTDQIRATGESLNSIVEAGQESETLAHSVQAMLKQQSSASHQIAATMERLSATVDANKAATDGVDSACHALLHTSSELRRLVEHMRSALG